LQKYIELNYTQKELAKIFDVGQSYINKLINTYDLRKNYSLTNQTFGRLTVLGKSKKRNKQNKILWICQCSCKDKTIIEVRRGSLTSGNTQSCGCIERENKIKRNKENKRIFTEIQKDEIINSYLKGNNIKYIEDQFNMSDYMVKDILKERNIELRQKKYNDFFENINTEEKAYWLGFLYADGSINKNAVDLTLQERDKNHLEKFLYSIHADVLIKDKNVILNNKEYKNKRITIHDSKMILDLKKCGCIENKSFTIRFPDINILPNNLIHHFIRGYFDGDGCIYGKDNQWGIDIISNIHFLQVMQRILVEQCELSYTKLYKNHNSETIRHLKYGGVHGIYKIYNYLYKDAKTFLERKYNKFQKFLNFYNNKYNIKRRD